MVEHSRETEMPVIGLTNVPLVLVFWNAGSDAMNI
jgi:hypothetical protein